MAQALITFVVHDEISKTDEFIRCIVEILPHVPQIMERVRDNFLRAFLYVGFSLYLDILRSVQLMKQVP